MDFCRAGAGRSCRSAVLGYYQRSFETNGAQMSGYYDDDMNAKLFDFSAVKVKETEKGFA